MKQMWVDGAEVTMIDTDGDEDLEVNNMTLLQMEESNQDKLYRLI